MAVSDNVTWKSHDSDNPLSEREMDVARLLATGVSNIEIARDLDISTHTVKVHLRNIYEKLQVNSRTEASMMLLQRGWLTIPGGELSGDAVDNVADAVPVPEPLPLSDVAATPTTWQRIYLLCGLIVTAVLFFTPGLFSRPRPGLNLLSDRGRPGLGQPQIVNDSSWAERTPLFEPRSRLAVAQLGDKVFALGGESPGGHTEATSYIYDLRVNEWSVAEPLPQPIANAAAAAINERIFLAGGSYYADDSSAVPTISATLWSWAESVQEGQANQQSRWRDHGSLPAPLAGAGLVAVGNELYLIGGWDGEKMHSELWRARPTTDASTPVTWDLVNHMELARAFFGVVLFQDKIYIVGGHDGQQPLSRADAFDPVSGTWTPLPPLVTPRSGLALTTDDRSVFAFGGGWDYSVSNHERFDPTTKLWSNFPSPVLGEWRHMIAYRQDNNLYLIGGWSDDYLDVHLMYKSLSNHLHLPLIQTN